MNTVHGMLFNLFTENLRQLGATTGFVLSLPAWPVLHLVHDCLSFLPSFGATSLSALLFNFGLSPVHPEEFNSQRLVLHFYSTRKFVIVLVIVPFRFMPPLIGFNKVHDYYRVILIVSVPIRLSLPVFFFVIALPHSCVWVDPTFDLAEFALF